jgi:hypothetical protein
MGPDTITMSSANSGNVYVNGRAINVRDIELVYVRPRFGAANLLWLVIGLAGISVYSLYASLTGSTGYWWFIVMAGSLLISCALLKLMLAVRQEGEFVYSVHRWWIERIRPAPNQNKGAGELAQRIADAVASYQVSLHRANLPSQHSIIKNRVLVGGGFRVNNETVTVNDTFIPLSTVKSISTAPTLPDLHLRFWALSFLMCMLYVILLLSIPVVLNLPDLAGGSQLFTSFIIAYFVVDGIIYVLVQTFVPPYFTVKIHTVQGATVLYKTLSYRQAQVLVEQVRARLTS